MSTPEGIVKAKVKKVLDKYEPGLYQHWPVQNGMGKPCLDAHCCVHGRYFAIETKAPGEKPTPRQKVSIRDITLAGGKVFVIDGDTSELEQWLAEITAYTLPHEA